MSDCLENLIKCIGAMQVNLISISFTFIIAYIMYRVGWVYILSSGNGNVLYVGVTNDLYTRVWEHRTKKHPKSFTAKYNVFRLLYYEKFELITDAIEREKYIKRKTRAWKDMLIDTMNPTRVDLYDSIEA